MPRAPREIFRLESPDELLAYVEAVAPSLPELLRYLVARTVTAEELEDVLVIGSNDTQRGHRGVQRGG